MFTKEWLRFSFKSPKCDDEELIQMGLDDRFSFSWKKATETRHGRTVESDTSQRIEPLGSTSKGVIPAQSIMNKLVFLEKVITNSPSFHGNFGRISFMPWDSTGEAALANLAISEFAPPTFCGKLFIGLSGQGLPVQR